MPIILVKRGKAYLLLAPFNWFSFLNAYLFPPFDF